jgi:hypothetical protein
MSSQIHIWSLSDNLGIYSSVLWHKKWQRKPLFKNLSLTILIVNFGTTKIRRPVNSSTRIFVNRTFVYFINMAKIRRPVNSSTRIHIRRPNIRQPHKYGENSSTKHSSTRIFVDPNIRRPEYRIRQHTYYVRALLGSSQMPDRSPWLG